MDNLVLESAISQNRIEIIDLRNFLRFDIYSNNHSLSITLTFKNVDRLREWLNKYMKINYEV